MASHGTIVRSSQIIQAGLPCVIAGLTLTLFIDPAVEHLSFLIKRILFRCTVCTDNGLKIHSSGILRFVSFSVSAEIIPYGIRLIVILRIIVFQLSPLAAHHDTTFIDIIVIVIVLYQLADCHLSVFIQPEPVIAGFFPGRGNRIPVFVIIVPGSVFLLPASGREGHHRTSNRQRCCRARYQ